MKHIASNSALLAMSTAIALTAGCSGSATPTTPPSPSALAARIGCTGYTAASPTLYAREEGGCNLGNDQLDIVTFATAGNQDNWLKVASQFGGVTVKGTLWVVAAGSQASADMVKAAIGGN